MPFGNLESHRSDSSEDSELVLKKFRTTFVYKFVRTLGSTGEAVQHVRSVKKWRLRKRHDTADGRKPFHDCEFSRTCPSKMYLFFDPTNQRVQVFKTEWQCNQPLKEYGLTEAARKEINSLLLIGVNKPKSILQALREKNIPEPRRRQIPSYLASRRSKNGKIFYAIVLNKYIISAYLLEPNSFNLLQGNQLYH
jgi:hypothetical protein